MNKIKVLTFSSIAVILLLTLKYCDKKKTVEVTDEKLKANEQAAIIIDNHSGKITRLDKALENGTGMGSALLRGGKPVPSTVPTVVTNPADGARNTRISIDRNGQISIEARYFGFINDFGIGVYKTPSDTRIFIDDQIFFYKRHGLNLGIGRSIADVSNQTEMQKYQLHAAYSYRLSFSKFTNTFVVMGLDTKKEVLLGLRVNF